MAELSIVISMYNSGGRKLKIIENLLFPSLLSNASKKYELILLDDCSPRIKETMKVLEKYAPELEKKYGRFEFIVNNSNLGFAGSYNKGMRRAKGKAILILNDDVYLPKGSVENMRKTLFSSDQVGAVVPVTNNAASFQYTNLYKRPKNYSSSEIDKIERFASWLARRMKNRKYAVKYPIGFCIMVKHDILKRVGLFDKRFKYGLMEDMDLNLRIRNKGHDIILDASIFVEHGGVKGASASFIQRKLKWIWVSLINILKFSFKWKNPFILFDQYSCVGFGYIHFNTITRKIKRGK